MKNHLIRRLLPCSEWLRKENFQFVTQSPRHHIPKVMSTKLSHLPILMKLGEHAGSKASRERFMEMMHESGQKGIDSVGLPFRSWRTLSDKGLGYMNAVYFDLRKGVISCKSRILLLKRLYLEAVIATDLKLAMCILTSLATLTRISEPHPLPLEAWCSF